MSFGIQMLTLPLTAWYYFEFPMYSILLNMLVLPLMALVLVTGLFGGGFGLVSYAASGTGFLGAAAGRFCGLASSGLLHACSLVLRYFSKMGNLFLKLPGAVYTAGQPSGWKMAVYYLILGGCVWMLYVIERKGERDAETSNDKRRR